MKKKFDKAKQNTKGLFDRLRSGTHVSSPVPPGLDPVRVQTYSPSVSREDPHLELHKDALSAMNELESAASQDERDLFLPLKAALASLFRFFAVEKDRWDIEPLIATFGSRVLAFEKSGKDGAKADSLRDHLRAIAEVVLRLWTEVGDTVDSLRHGSEVKRLLDVLSNMLGFFEPDHNTIVGNRMAVDRQHLSSRESPAEHKTPVMSIINQNHNTNYGFGGIIFNNNPVYLFQGGTVADHPAPDMKKQVTTMKEIISFIGNHFVPDALYDAQPKGAGCMTGTRVDILKRCIDWARSDFKSILWLAGMAGTGKTSIAVTLCRMLQEQPDVILAGSFFCSRTSNDEARADVRRILPTLATSLANQSSRFAAKLADELMASIGVAAHRPVSGQIRPLLQHPLAALSSETCSIVFVIDGLDECSNDREVNELLGEISAFTCSARFKFFITSRPETQIRGSPISDRVKNEVLQLHALDADNVTEDIRTYIDHMFTRNPLGTSEPWYSGTDVQTLANLANGLFVFASTAIGYILDTWAAEDRMARLRTTLSIANSSKVATGPLDEMYEFVITRATSTSKVEPQELARTQLVLACILTSRMPISLTTLAELLGKKVDILRASLQRLRAVIHVPEEPDQPGLQALHASFRDYLLQRASAGVRIDRSLGDDALALGCLKMMEKRLHFNISQSRSSYEANPLVKPNFIALSLEYACLHWIYHISDVSRSSLFDKSIDVVFRPRILFWLEVMSVLGQVPRAAAMLVFAAVTVQSTDLARFFRDANLFVASSRAAIERSAPHIYISALPMAPKDSLLYQTFFPLCTGLVSVDTYGVERHGGRLVMMLMTGHEDGVTSVAYCPDGRFIGSGSRDGTVRTWDMRTGEETMSPRRSGDGTIAAISFSPNGKSLVSGTASGVVCIWDLEVFRSDPQRLVGHSGMVFSVDFSSNSFIIGSGSEDKTVRLWSAESGDQLAVMSGHSLGVRTVRFSLDGSTLASNSADNVIKMWHGTTGEPIDLPPHSTAGIVSGAAFSPDVQMLASGFAFEETQIWDTHAGKSIAMLEGYSDKLMCICFSPDGQSLVSCGWDATLRLWTRKRNGVNYESVVLGSHGSHIHSVAFSPDGSYLVSASNDGAIGVWDTSNGHAAVQPLQAHEDSVFSMVTSADGTFIVTGSADKTVRIWDTLTGKQKLSPLKGHTSSVTLVGLVSDGSMIASASHDDSIRFWDTGTGESVGVLEPGVAIDFDRIALSPDSRFLAAGSYDGTVRILEISTGQLSGFVPQRCRHPISAVSFSPDGRILAAAEAGGYTYLWYAETGQPTHPPLWVSDHSIRSVGFSPDGGHVVAGRDEGLILIWDAIMGRIAGYLFGHTDSVVSVAYSLDNRFIVSSSFDGSVRLWDSVTGAQICALHGQVMNSATLTNDNRFIATLSGHSTIRVWDVEAALALPSSNLCPIKALALSSLVDGWLLGPAGELLLWVPPDYRPYIQVPPCITLVGKHRVVVNSDASGLCAGDDWTSCWSNAMSK